LPNAAALAAAGTMNVKCFMDSGDNRVIPNVSKAISLDQLKYQIMLKCVICSFRFHLHTLMLPFVLAHLLCLYLFYFCLLSHLCHSFTYLPYSFLSFALSSACRYGRDTQIQYEDEDKDRITIDTQALLQQAIEAIDAEKNTLKIYLLFKTGAGAAAAATAAGTGTYCQIEAIIAFANCECLHDHSSLNKKRISDLLCVCHVLKETVTTTCFISFGVV
jgi:hypothetical protein